MDNKLAKPFFAPPCLRSECNEQEERRASWMELFFDLIYVVAIGAMAAVEYLFGDAIYVSVGYCFYITNFYADWGG